MKEKEIAWGGRGKEKGVGERESQAEPDAGSNLQLWDHHVAVIKSQMLKRPNHVGYPVQKIFKQARISLLPFKKIISRQKYRIFNNIKNFKDMFQ